MADYHGAIMRRLSLIDDIGKDATRHANLRNSARQPQSSAPPVGETQTFGNATTRGNNFDAFVNSITAQESGGNYGAVNRHSGALGRYQIMPGNISNWSRSALGRSVTPQQFLGSREIQDRVARHQLQQYYNQYGPGGAAVAWYAGPGNANKWVKTNGAGYNKKQGSYPSINMYVQSILRRMGM